MASIYLETGPLCFLVVVSGTLDDELFVFDLDASVHLHDYRTLHLEFVADRHG